MALLLGVALAGGWLAGRTPEVPPPPIAEEVLALPVFNATDHLLVVEAHNTSFEERLTLASLQGLVNRELAQVYLDREGELNDPESLLNFLLGRYNLTYEVVPPGEFLADSALLARGLVVYDPSRPATLNVAATLAGLEGLVIVDPGRAQGLAGQLGLEVVRDLRRGEWAGLGRLELQEHAFKTLYVKAAGRPLLALNPKIDLMVDYGVASRAFVYYLNPGPFSTPAEQGLFKKLVKGSNPGVPLLGWFDQPTGVEENYAVQVASTYGHFFVGGSRLPNLSLLSAYGRGDLTPPPPPNWRPSYWPQGPMLGMPKVPPRTYLAFAVTDGDNVEFFVRRGRELWNQPVRGRLPLAWSVSPALAELAPPLLERTYLEATANDSFLAGPSGLGYFYPGFLPPGHLEPLLERSKGLMNQSYLDTVWLLNSFSTYETPYARKDLETYGEVLRPRGLLLDYGDVPVTRPFWQTSGGGASAPVVRVTHLWGSTANLEAKLALALAENDPAKTGQPHFVVVGLMSIDHDLDEVWEVYQGLDPQQVEVVNLPTLFLIMKNQWAQRAKGEVENGDWVVGRIWGDDLDTARHLYEDPQDWVPAAQGYRAWELAAQARDRAALLTVGLSGLAVAGAILITAVHRRRPRGARAPWERFWRGGGGGRTLLALPALTALWLLGLMLTDRLLHANFWHYGWLAVGFGAAAALPTIGRRWRVRLRRLPRLRPPGRWRGPLLGAGLLAGLGLFAYHPAGYAVALPGLVAAARELGGRLRPGPPTLVLSFAAAIALAALAPTFAMGPLWLAGLVGAVGLVALSQPSLARPAPSATGEAGADDQHTKLESGPGDSTKALVAAAGLALASLPWYLDRSYFWANHLHFHMTLLAGLGWLLPLLAALLIAALALASRGAALLGERCLAGLRKLTGLPLPLLGLLVGVALYAGAAAAPGLALPGLLLVGAEGCWLGAAWLAMGSRGILVRPANEAESASQTPPASFFLTVLAFQAALALWLTIPPVFYAVYLWPGAPWAVDYLLYHTPLALAVGGLLVLLFAVVKRGTRGRVTKAGIRCG